MLKTFDQFVNEDYRPFSNKDVFYKVFICSGKPGSPNYRESGSYSTRGDDFIQAAEEFAKSWDKGTKDPKYGTKWKSLKAEYKGLPDDSFYVGDEKGNRLLLVLDKYNTEHAKKNWKDRDEN